MTNEEKIRLLEETLDIEAYSLTEETLISEINELDSMGKLSLIVLCDEEFGKKLTGEKIREFVTVKDIIDFMS